MHCFRCLIMLCAILTGLLCPGKTMAYSSIVDPASSVLSQSSDPFAVGQSLVNPKTPTLSLQELVDRVAGKPSLSKYTKYEGDFDRYWQAGSSQRAGKTFEALVAYKKNNKILSKVLAVLGCKHPIVVTAAEGARSHPADLLKICKHGQIVKRYQLKLGWGRAVKALGETKYAGMSILTPKDQLAIIQKKLLKEQAALQRGKALSEYWSAVKQALDEGRLRGTKWTRAEVRNLAKRTAERRWREIGAAGQAAHPARGLGNLARLSNVAGKSLIVLDVAGNLYFTYRDIQRFQTGEIGGRYLALKTGLRGAQVGLTYYAVVSPELFSKGLAAVAVAVLVTADIATEGVHDVFLATEQETARQLLESIDRDERYHATRRYLLYTMNGFRGSPTESR